MSNEVTDKKQTKTKVVGGKVRFSYAYVFQSKLNDQNGKHEFSVAVLIPKKDKNLVAKFQSGIEAAIEQGITNKKEWGGKRPTKLQLPLKDGDKEKPNDPVYKGMYYVSAKSTNRPGVVDADCKAIMDESEFYSGCWGNVSINFYPYGPVKGNVGIGAGLLNLQKTEEGEKLSGGSTPEEDFGKAKDDDDDEEIDFLGDSEALDDLPF